MWENVLLRNRGLTGRLESTLTVLALAADSGLFAQRVFDLVRRQAAGDATFGLLAAKDLSLLTQLSQATSVESVWTELAGWSDQELRWALHHMNWRNAEPEPLVREFLLSDRLRELGGEAAVCFFNTLGTVVGSFASALELELERSKSWHASLEGSTASDWAAELVDRYEAGIQRHRQREDEERIRSQVPGRGVTRRQDRRLLRPR